MYPKCAILGPLLFITILGPLLFIIIINDLCYIKLQSTKAMFADDTTLVHAGNNLNKTAHEIENDLEVIAEWLKHNRLLLNVKKSNAMIFRWKYQRKQDHLNTNIDALEEIEIKCDNEKIPFVTKFTLLGVTLDQYLTFDLHTISICSKINWKISVLKKSSYLFDLKFRVILFKLFIISKYDYCSSLFIHFSDNINSERLENNIFVIIHFCKIIEKDMFIDTILIKIFLCSKFFFCVFCSFFVC
jgi:hypothetical protein